MVTLLSKIVRPPARVSASAPKTIASIKANLVGNFAPQGISPLPFKRPEGSPVKIFHFIEAAAKWEEFDIASFRGVFENVTDSQLAVSEAPVKMRIGVTACAAVILYDRDRKVGAAMHFHNWDRRIYEGYISLALYKMGVLDHRTKVEGRILGVQFCSSYRDSQIGWVNRIRSFLEECSIEVLSDNIGRGMEVNFDLSDGSVRARDL